MVQNQIASISQKQVAKLQSQGDSPESEEELQVQTIQQGTNYNDNTLMTLGDTSMGTMNDTIFDSVPIPGAKLDLSEGNIELFKEIDAKIEELKPGDEDKAHKEFLIKRFQDFPEFINIKGYKTYEGLTIVINSMINLVSNLTNITYVIKLTKELVSWDVNIIKLVSFLSYMLVVVLVVEPEKLKYLTIITTILFMGISKHSKHLKPLFSNIFSSPGIFL